MGDDDAPPTNLYQTANWLGERHPWAGQLTRRIAGNSEQWLDEVAGGILDTTDNRDAWEQYEREHPAPRLIATLANVRGETYVGEEYRSYERRVPWSAHDFGGWDERGVAIFNDRVTILRTQVG